VSACVPLYPCESACVSDPLLPRAQVSFGIILDGLLALSCSQTSTAHADLGPQESQHNEKPCDEREGRIGVIGVTFSYALLGLTPPNIANHSVF
jgi:hypothetical protein